MKIRIISVGKSSPIAIQSLQDMYSERLSRWANLQWQLIAPQKTPELESEMILKNVKSTELLILLDERGQMPDNDQLVSKYEQWLQSGRQLVFVIGGAFGVTDAVRQRSDFVWSLSSLVFPHEIMRVLVAEQLYRTANLRAGGKYHHV